MMGCGAAVAAAAAAARDRRAAFRMRDHVPNK